MEAANKDFGLRAGADIRVLSQPDAVAAAQYFDGLKRQASLDPEAELPRGARRRSDVLAEESQRARRKRTAPLPGNGLDSNYLRRGLRQETSDRSAVKRSAA